MSDEVVHGVDVWFFCVAAEGVAERRGLRDQVLAGYVGGSEVVVGKESYGRPELVGESVGGLSFNESHIAGYYGIAVCCTGRVGFDVEGVSDAGGLAECYAGGCGDLADGGSDVDALRQWVRKEAILKAWGLGLSYNPAQLDLGLWSGSELSSGVSVVVGDVPVVFEDVELGDAVVGAVALWDCCGVVDVRVRMGCGL